MNKKNNRKGFTTVELVIVIAVIAILATVLIPTFSNLINKANDSKYLQTAKTAHTTYMTDFDYTTGGNPETNILVKVIDGTVTKWFAIVDGQLISTAFDSDAKAGEKFENNKVYETNGAVANFTFEGVEFYKIKEHTTKTGAGTNCEYCGKAH